MAPNNQQSHSQKTECLILSVALHLFDMHRTEVHEVLLQEDMVFAELVDNVLVAIKYFNDMVERARKEGGWDWSVEKVLEVIKGAPAPVGRALSLGLR